MSTPRGKTIRPSSSGPGRDASTVLILGAFGAGFCVDTAVFIGGHLASLLAGHRWAGPKWTITGFLDLGRIPARWPGASPTTVWVATVATLLVLLTVIAVPAVSLRRIAKRASPAGSGMASRTDMASLTQPAAIASAKRLRPSLHDSKPAQVSVADAGVSLGRLLPTGGRLFATWEDVILAVFAPRSGKTTGLAIPALLAAPGPVLACSNKSDLYLATAQLRAEKTSERVWVFDAQDIVHLEQTWWWNPLGGAMTMDDAVRLAGSFVMAVAKDDDREIWGPAAAELLSNLFLAANLEQKTLVDVYEWLFDETNQEPVQILRGAGHVATAASLKGLQGLPPETRGSVYFTARAGMSSLRDRNITRWITPQTGLDEFRPDLFMASNQTLYLMSKNVKGGTSAAAIISALTNEVRVAAERRGERLGGRLDPPLVLVLDEVANICRIPDLPEQYSHLGSRSVVPIAILQSYAQGERVWGKSGMRELWGAATIKMVGSGADDQSFAEEISKLVGEHDVDVLSYSHQKGNARSGGSTGSSSVSTRKERIITAAEIRSMPKTQAILLATGMKAAMVKLPRWFETPDAARITAALTTATAELVARANRTELQSGPVTLDNPFLAGPAAAKREAPSAP